MLYSFYRIRKEHNITLKTARTSGPKADSSGRPEEPAATMTHRKDYLNPGKLESKPIQDTRSWYDWFWGIPAQKPMKPTDASQHPLLRGRFTTLLDNTDPPASFKASEVAQALREDELQQMGYEKWEEAVPAVIELAFELRAFGDCEVLKQGKLVPDDVMAMEIQGGCRIRRKNGPGWFDD